MPGPPPSDPRATVWLSRALVAVAVAPIVIATVAALADGWIPIGDNGLILLRVQDVGTAHNPLTGTWTSASLTLGEHVQNPGPLWFDFLAPFVRLLGPSVGMATGVMVSNVAAVVLAAWCARRAAGRRAMAVITVLSAGLAWSMGADLLYDPLQPNAMLLPFWALLVALWALAQGDIRLAPLIAFVASLIVQTHVAFVYLVALAGAAALAMCVLELRRRPEAQSWRLPTLWSVGVALACWAQPLYDQVAGNGNLGRLFANVGGGDGDVTVFGLRLSTRIVAAVVALPPWWGRPSYNDTIRRQAVIEPSTDPMLSAAGGPTFLSAVVGLAVVVLLLAAAVWWGRRRGDRPVKLLAVFALAAGATSILSLASSPVNIIGLTAHQLRWLWPVGALVTAAVLVPVARWSPRPPAVLAVAGVATLAFAVATLTTDTAAGPAAGPIYVRSHQPSVEVLVDAIDDYEPDGRILFDTSTLLFGEPYSGPVVAALGRNGIDFATEDEGFVSQIGSRREADGTEERRLVIIEGSAALAPPEGAVAVAVVPALDADAAAALERAETELVRHVVRHGLRLNDRGRRVAADDWIDVPDIVAAAGSSAQDVDVAEVAMLLREGYVEVPPDMEDAVERYLDLLDDARRRPVGLFELPAG